MQKSQYIILAVSIFFLAICLFVTETRLKANDPRGASVPSGRDSIIQNRLDAIEQAKNTGQTQYEFESMVAPPLI